MSKSLPKKLDLLQDEDDTRPLMHATLREIELQTIHDRRQQAGFEQADVSRRHAAESGTAVEPSADTQDTGHHATDQRRGSQATEDSPDLVGLAFSGGGIRSAAFNLGLAQALHYFGLYRFVDYLSGVSGGSYVSAMLSHSVAQQGEYNRNTFEYASEPSGRQGMPVRKLVKNGNYLVRLDLIANRYVAGFLLNCIPLISLLIAMGAGVAWLWRSLDYDYFRDRLDGLGFNSDFAPAILPAVLIFLAWFTFYVLALWLQSEPLKKCTNRLFWFGLLCVLIGGAVLLGNGDITRSGSGGVVAITEQHFIGRVLFFGALLGLIPLLRPDQLIRSGAAPRRYLESWLFYYTSFVLLLGLPLILVAAFARENVSGYGKWRGPELLRGEFKDSSAFCQWLRDPDITNVQVGDYLIKLDAKLLLEATGGVVPKKTKETEDGQSKTDDPKYENSVRWAAVKFLIKNAEFSSAHEQILGTSRWHGEHQRSPLTSKEPATATQQKPEENKKETNSKLAVQTTPSAEKDDAKREAVQLQQLQDTLVAQDLRIPGFDKVVNPTATKSGEEAYLSEDILRDWRDWRYWNYFDRWASFAGSFFVADAAYMSYLKLVKERREAEIELCRRLNRDLLGEKELFDIVLMDNDEKIFEKIDSSDVSSSDKKLLAIAKEFDADRPGEGWEQTMVRNRRILELMLPDMVREQTAIRRTTVHAADQWHRLIWFSFAAVVFLISSILIDPNSTSLHDYYRDRIGFAFLGEPLGLPNESRMALAKCRPHEHGAPYPLFGAAVCEQSPLVHPEQLEVRFSEFLISPLYCGSKRLGYVRTDEYVPATSLTVADATAISGAALSPNYFVHHIVMVLMTLLNLRMGKWLPNPLFAPLKRFRPRLLKQFRYDLEPNIQDRRILQVTDGGHVENLGLGELLERRCKLIIMSDAGQDADFAFTDFARLVRRYRNMYGVEFLELDGKTRLKVSGRFPTRTVQADKKSKSVSHRALDKPFKDDGTEQRHFFLARIRYPGDKDPTGLLYYIKPCLTGSEDADLYSYAVEHPEFPHDSTADQAFSAAQFESYRRLGAITGEDICRSLTKNPDILWREKNFDLLRLLTALDAPLNWESLQLLIERHQDGDKQASDRISRLEDDAAPFVRQLLERFDSDDILQNLGHRGIAEMGSVLLENQPSNREAQELVRHLASFLKREEFSAAAADILRRAVAEHPLPEVQQLAKKALARPASGTRRAAPGGGRRATRNNQRTEGDVEED